jgi:hypothetical protein
LSKIAYEKARTIGKKAILSIKKSHLATLIWALLIPDESLQIVEEEEVTKYISRQREKEKSHPTYAVRTRRVHPVSRYRHVLLLISESIIIYQYNLLAILCFDTKLN